MYVTRPLSLYRDSSSSLGEPEGPNTGVLVIEDEASERRWFFGLLKDNSVNVPPFPQNKLLELQYLKRNAAYGRSYRRFRHRTEYFHAMLIPVLNQPSDSNQYYIIHSCAKTKGLACTSSKEDDIITCCCFNFIDDIQPQLFDPTNVYQQFQITNKYTYFGSPDGFVSNSMALDGVPPHFLRHQGWTVDTKTLENFEPTPAFGVDAALRASLPEPDSSVVVGKWCCPFIFIRDGEIGAQMRDSAYYEMTLQQSWEEIFECYNTNNDNNNGHVAMDVRVRRNAVLVRGALLGEERVVVSDGVVWFGRSSEVGLSMAIVERVKWEEERVGFLWGETLEDREIERVVRREEFEGKGVWKRFRCYVLVEMFVLNRMDGTLVLTWKFRHTHQIRTKWE